MESCVTLFGLLYHKLSQNNFVYGLWFIIILHLGLLLIADDIRSRQHDKSDVTFGEYFIMITLLSIEWIVVIFQTKLLLKYIFLTDLKPIMCLYISNIIAFSDIYLLLFKTKSQFSHPEDLITTSNTSYIELSLIFFNYSTSEQTCTGVADVVPVGIAAELFSAVQIIFFGITYNVFILSVAILRFSDFNNNNQNKSEIKKSNSKKQGLLQQVSASQGSISMSNFFQFSQESATGDLLNYDKFKINEKYLKYHELFYKYMFFICFAIELLKLIIIYFICNDTDCDSSVIIIGLIIDIMLLVACIITVIIKLKMVALIGAAARINNFILTIGSSYLISLLLFATLYFDLFLLTKNSSYKAFQINYDIDNYWKMILHFVYFSTTSYTEHGSESVVNTWRGYCQLINGFQMIIGVAFISIVFGICLLDIGMQRTIATEHFIQQQLQKSASISAQDIISNDNNLNKSTTKLYKAGLLTRKVSRMLVVANKQNIANNSDNHIRLE